MQNPVTVRSFNTDVAMISHSINNSGVSHSAKVVASMMLIYSLLINEVFEHREAPKLNQAAFCIQVMHLLGLGRITGYFRS